MKTPLKQYEGLVTAWRYNTFVRARVELTFLYVTLIACVLGLFSVFLLHTVQSELRADDERREYLEQSDVLSDMFYEDFRENLFMTDLLILLASSVLSFLLAGRTLRPIEATLRQHEAFSGNVAHELRTPLSALYATASATLRNEATQKEYKETLEDMKHETKRLIDLTERLLKTTRGEVVSQRAEIQVGALLGDVISKMEALATIHGVDITLDSRPLCIQGDFLKLQELFLNLIHNAIKFSHKGGVVEVAVRKDGVVTVTDHGVGIRKDALPHVFERFYTTDNSRDERGERGTGLGLAIASQIASEHHAKIGIESEVGVGTVVTVTFPVA